MERKLTIDEIKNTARMIDKLRRENNDKGKEAAREFQARMIMCGNTDSESIRYFNEYSGYTWSDL